MLPPAELFEFFLAVLKNFFNSLLVSAGLFLAILTSERIVCILGESLRIQLVHHFPNYE